MTQRWVQDYFEPFNNRFAQSGPFDSHLNATSHEPAFRNAQVSEHTAALVGRLHFLSFLQLISYRAMVNLTICLRLLPSVFCVMQTIQRWCSLATMLICGYFQQTYGLKVILPQRSIWILSFTTYMLTEIVRQLIQDLRSMVRDLCTKPSRQESRLTTSDSKP